MPRAKKKIHYIYKTTCTVTGRYYIGMHSTNNLDDGYLGSGKRLRYSIRKHGKKNHTKEILEYCNTRDLLAEREKQLITEDIRQDPLCMNLMGGGGGGLVDSMTLDKLKEIGKLGNLAYSDRLKTDLNFKCYLRDLKSKNIQMQFESGIRMKCHFYDWTGKKHKPKTIEKMKLVKQGHGSGETNSQYGTCWITKDTTTIKIQSSTLEQYILDGWHLGRK